MLGAMFWPKFGRMRAPSLRSTSSRELPSRHAQVDPKILAEVLAHPWLRNPCANMDSAVSREVLSNLRNFSNTSQFFSLCVASVARQLDHRSLRDVHKVFCEMDTNGDGVLELKEVKDWMCQTGAHFRNPQKRNDVRKCESVRGDPMRSARAGVDACGTCIARRAAAQKHSRGGAEQAHKPGRRMESDDEPLG